MSIQHSAYTKVSGKKWYDIQGNNFVPACYLGSIPIKWTPFHMTGIRYGAAMPSYFQSILKLGLTTKPHVENNHSHRRDLWSDQQMDGRWSYREQRIRWEYHLLSSNKRRSSKADKSLVSYAEDLIHFSIFFIHLFIQKRKKRHSQERSQKKKNVKKRSRHWNSQGMSAFISFQS